MKRTWILLGLIVTATLSSGLLLETAYAVDQKYAIAVLSEQKAVYCTDGSCTNLKELNWKAYWNASCSCSGTLYFWLGPVWDGNWWPSAPSRVFQLTKTWATISGCLDLLHPCCDRTWDTTYCPPNYFHAGCTGC